MGAWGVGEPQGEDVAGRGAEGREGSDLALQGQQVSADPCGEAGAEEAHQVRRQADGHPRNLRVPQQVPGDLCHGEQCCGRGACGQETVCYGADAWCVIVAGKRGADDKLEKPLLDIMTASKGKHSGGTVKLSFMWVDAEREKTFVSALGIDSAPKVAVLRTGKRTRCAKSED